MGDVLSSHQGAVVGGEVTVLGGDLGEELLRGPVLGLAVVARALGGAGIVRRGERGLALDVPLEVGLKEWEGERKPRCGTTKQIRTSICLEASAKVLPWPFMMMELLFLLLRS